MKPTELLACPFCGSAARESQADGTYDRVNCTNCQVVIISHQAVADWNTRSTPPPQARAEDAECEHNHLGGYSPLVDATWCMDCKRWTAIGRASHVGCMDCGFPYSEFGIDLVMPRAQWMEIHPQEDGVLCANCMMQRASKVKGATCVHAIIEIFSSC